RGGRRHRARHRHRRGHGNRRRHADAGRPEVGAGRPGAQPGDDADHRAEPVLGVLLQRGAHPGRGGRALLARLPPDGSPLAPPGPGRGRGGAQPRHGRGEQPAAPEGATLTAPAASLAPARSTAHPMGPAAASTNHRDPFMTPRRPRRRTVPLRAALGATILLGAAACGGAEGEAADLVLRGGNVVTVDSAMPHAQALAVRAGRSPAVGCSDELEACSWPGTRVIDMEGRTAIPGFIEGHAHYMRLGAATLELYLTNAATWDDIVDLVAAA